MKLYSPIFQEKNYHINNIISPKEVLTHPSYLTNMVIDFPSSGKITQKILDFYIEVYSGKMRT